MVDHPQNRGTGPQELFVSNAPARVQRRSRTLIIIITAAGGGLGRVVEEEEALPCRQVVHLVRQPPRHLTSAVIATVSVRLRSTVSAGYGDVPGNW